MRKARPGVFLDVGSMKYGDGLLDVVWVVLALRRPFAWSHTRNSNICDMSTSVDANT